MSFGALSGRRCKIAPSIGEWAAQQNGRQDKLLRRHLTRHAATSRQTVALQLDSDKQPTRRQRRKQRAAERAKQLRSQSADDVATLGGPPALPPLSFADTMRFGHDLSVAIATNKAEEAGGGKGSVSFQDALELDAAIEAADGEGQGGLLVDLLSLEVVSTAIGDAMFDIFGTRAEEEEEEEEEEDATPTAVAATQQERQKKRNKLHINSTLGTTLGNQGHDRNGHPQDMPQPLGACVCTHWARFVLLRVWPTRAARTIQLTFALCCCVSSSGTCLFPPLRTSTAHLESNPEEKGVMAAACFNLATKHLKAVGSAAKPRSNIPSLLCRHRRAVWPIQVAPQAGGKPPPGSKLGGTAKWTGSAAASWPMTSTEAQRPNREGRKERRE
jgi:hypothetical protein